MKQLYAIMVWMMLLTGGFSSWAHEVTSDSLILLSDSLESDTLNLDPEWYVAPVIPASLRAPMRAHAATSCSRVEAIQTFNIDSVLTEGTYYEYDAKGNVISTTVWAYAPDGTMTGKSKNEYAFDATGTQTMTAVYIWDGAANDWKGTEKYEYVYKTFAGEKKMISNTSSVWLNGAWVADQRFTYDYDASLREISYFEYRRNTSTNELQPVKGREQSWTDDLQTLEVLYTAYANGKWTAGTKKEWAFDEGGAQTMYATYSMSNGAWVGSSKETWTYGGPSAQLTLHEKYGWANNDWSKTLKEETEYAGANIIRIENYSYTNGVASGTKKETWGFANGKQTLHQAYTWLSNAWSLSLQEENEYDGANLIRVENYIYTNGVATGTKKEEYTFNTAKKKTLSVIYQWENNDWVYATKAEADYQGANQTMDAQYTWTNGVWVGTSKQVWGYTSGKQTLHETYAWETTAWTIATQENTTYTSGKITRIENYEWVNGVKTGTQKEEYVYTSGVKTETIISSWANNDWVYSTKKEAGYREGNTEVSEANYTWNGTSWVGSGTRIISTYNSKNFITEILRQDWPEGATDWVNSARAIDTFNDDGVNIMTYVTAWNGSAWRLYSMTRTDIIKDEAGRELLNASWSCESDSIWKGVKKDTAAYTATGKPLYSASYKAWANGDWVPYMKGEYTYDDAGRQVLYMQYDGTNGVWVNKAKTEQAYDAAGNQILLQGFNWSNNAWVGVYKYEYAFDAKGRQTMQAHYEWSSGRWSGFSRSETEYDAAGNVSASISFKWKNNAWVGNSRTENVYDAKKRVVEYTLKKWQSNKWVNSRHTIYVYDSFDRLVSTRQYWWYNNEWTIYGINESTYDPSTNVLRRELSVSWLDNEIDSYSDDHYYYNCDPHFYTVRFVNYDGQVLANMTAQEGETPTYVGPNPTREGNAEYSYTFSGWTPALAPVTANITYTATFTATKNTYTITWKNEDGTVLQSGEVAYGEAPVYTGEMPSRPNTAEYTYTFAGWTPGIGIVTSDAEYIATYDSVRNSYTITWLNSDNSPLAQTTVAYGEAPVYTGEMPSRPNTAEYTYTFTGWSPEIVTVTEAATYTATFTATKNTYTITWKNEDGTVLQSGEVAYGEAPVYTGEMPSRPNTAENTYTFAGWDKEVVTVTEAATYIATYTATKKTYTITWKNEDGTVLQSGEVAYGEAPVYTGEMPSRPNTAENTYTFAGWDKEVVTVTEAATYTATFTATMNSYTITWKNEDGTVLQSGEVAYGEAPVYIGEMPSRPNTAEYTYTFTGWTPEIVPVTGDAEYTATYTTTKNSYTITWKNEDGTVLQSGEVAYGEAPVYTGEMPSRPNTAENTYTFAGWDKEVVTVTEDATYTATYTTTKNSYTITWKNEDGSVIESETLEYGATPAHANIYKENTAEYTYTFAGWSPQIVPVAGDAEYTATFTATKNTYTITWKNEDGTVLQSGEVAYGEAPVYIGEMPSRPNTAEYTYTFAGWTPALAPVTANITYTATFTATKNTYTITWKNEDGTVLQSGEVAYGEAPVYTGEMPSRPNTAEYTYTFTGWSPEIVTVTEAATYIATYTATKKTYTITWKNEDGTVLQSGEVAYGEAPVYTGEMPSRPTTAEYTYTFTGWTPQIVPVTGDATYTATYTATERLENKTFTITFYYEEGGIVVDRVVVAYGETPSTNRIPSMPSDERYYYTFSGWSPEIVPANSDADYVATFTAIPIEFRVTFKNYNGRELQSILVPYGEMPEYTGEIPTRPSNKLYTYTFIGWTPQITEVTGNATYTALFETVSRTQDVEEVKSDNVQIEKVLKNGILYIMYNGTKYNLQGQRVQ